MVIRQTIKFTERRSSTGITIPQQRPLTLARVDDIATRQTDTACNHDVRDQYGDTTSRCKTLIEERRPVYHYHNNGRLQWRACTILSGDAIHTTIKCKIATRFTRRPKVRWRHDKRLQIMQINSTPTGCLHGKRGTTRNEYPCITESGRTTTMLFGRYHRCPGVLMAMQWLYHA